MKNSSALLERRRSLAQGKDKSFCRNHSGLIVISSQNGGVLTNAMLFYSLDTYASKLSSNPIPVQANVSN